MSNFFNWLASNGQIVAILLFFGISAFGGVARWLREQAAKKKAEAQRKRKIEDQLRTGRVETVPQPEAAAEAAESEETFADRRRRQIEEMRRRQEAAQQQREAARRQTPQPEPVAIPTPRRCGATQPGPELTAPAASKPSEEMLTLAQRFEQRSQREQRQRGPARPAGHPLGAGLTPGLDRDQLRRAVVLAEVLSSPLALREDGSRPV